MNQPRIIVMTIDDGFALDLINFLNKYECKNKDATKVLMDSIPEGEPLDYGVEVGEWYPADNHEEDLK